MNSILYGLLSYFSWGAGDIFGAIAARKIGGFQTTFWIMIVASIILLPFIPSQFGLLSEASVETILVTILFGFLYQSGNIAVSEALKTTDASIVLTIMGTFGALVALFSAVALHTPLTTYTVLCMIGISIGVFLVTRQETTIASQKKGVILSLYSAVSFGAFFTFGKYVSPILGWFWPIYLSFLWLPLLTLVFARLGQPLNRSLAKQAFLPIFFAATLLRFGDIVFNTGLMHGNPSVIAPIASASPTASVILAFIVFRERLSVIQYMGIAITLIGIVALGAVS